MFISLSNVNDPKKMHTEQPAFPQSGKMYAQIYLQP